jgi:hypothetical protein
MDEIEEAGRTAEAIRADLELLLVRGIASSSPKDRRPIEVHAEEWAGLGAHHVASALQEALRAADAGAHDAPSKFLSAFTSLHTFERVLSLDAAIGAWSSVVEGETGPGDAAEPERASPAPLEDPKGALRILEDLAHVVEDLVRSGLTSASAATRAKLDAAFKEASRRKLLRLGASLRYVNEEIGRFLANDGTFAARRYGFFLHRSWLLSKGTIFAIEKGDARLVSALTMGSAAAPKPCRSIEVVTIGIGKRSVASACTFDFRLRVTAADDPALVGRALVFGLVFARKSDVIAEAYLHLPQPQKYTPKILREPTRILVTDAAIVPDARMPRLILGPKSTVKAGAPFEDFLEVTSFDPAAALRRAAAHDPSPLDLAVELQEEIRLDDWTITKTEGRHPFVIHAHGLVFDVAVSVEGEGEELRDRLAELVKRKQRPPLFGLVHYEGGRLLLQPLSLLSERGAEHLQLSNEKINLAALLGSLNIG